MFNLNGHRANGRKTQLQHILQQITDDVISHLGCVVAAVTTIEPDGRVELQAHALGLPQETAVPASTVRATGPLNWGGQRRRSMSTLNTSMLPRYGRNTSFTLADHLYEPLRHNIDKLTADWIQQELQVNQVLSLPIILENEEVGTLIAATDTQFEPQAIDILTAFSRQAASAIQSQKQFNVMAALEQLILSLQATVTDENQILQKIVDAVVFDLGYIGAMVATLEPGNRLPVRAYQVDVATEILQQLEKRAGISMISPKTYVVLDDERYKDNLSVRAVRGNQGRPQKYAISKSLHDLFTPLVAKPLSDIMQRILGIQQVIAVPFLMSDKVVGNLFVATRKPAFSDWEITMLTTLGQQAAVGIRNARLYREANEHLEVAEMFGRMAFSATASIHALRNHISAVSTYLDFLGMVSETAEPQQIQQLLKRSRTVSQRLHKAADIIDHLHEPWRQAVDETVNVNDCLIKAVKELFPELLLDDHPKQVTVGTGITIQFDLTDNLPGIQTSPDMLVEAFRILIKNATEAMLESKNKPTLFITSSLEQTGHILVKIRDTGTGIREEDIPHIFRMGWSTKKGKGMGFGLFWTKDFVTGLGGEIAVFSEWGKGTTFRIHLPPNN